MKPYCLLIALCVAPGCDQGKWAPPGGGGVDSGSVPVQPIYYRPSIQNDLEAASCVTVLCHGGDPDTPMQLTASPRSDAEWLANYNAVKASASLLVKRSQGIDGIHTLELEATAPELNRFSDWTAQGAPYEKSSGPAQDGGVAPPPRDAGETPVWAEVYFMLNASGCVDCHKITEALGAYSLETYDAALGFGADGDVPNVIAGDATSLLAQYCVDGHEGASAALATEVMDWIVAGEAAEQ